MPWLRTRIGIVDKTVPLYEKRCAIYEMELWMRVYYIELNKYPLTSTKDKNTLYKRKHHTWIFQKYQQNERAEQSQIKNSNNSIWVSTNNVKNSDQNSEEVWLRVDEF